MLLSLLNYNISTLFLYTLNFCLPMMNSLLQLISMTIMQWSKFFVLLRLN